MDAWEDNNMMDPEEFFKMLQGREINKRKRGRVLATLNAEERMKFDILETLTSKWGDKMRDLRMEEKELMLRRDRWWAEIGTAYKLHKIEGMQYDETEGNVYELIPDDGQGHDRGDRG